MARGHGKQVRVYLGSRDVSGDLSSIDITASAETHDRTTFASAGWKGFDGGLRSWNADFEAFYQPDVGGIGRQLEAVGDNTAGLGVLSVYDGDADAVGDYGWLGSEAVLASRGQPINVNDLIRLRGSLAGNGRAGMVARLLHPLGAESSTGNGSSVDNSASSANGGRANLHVTAATGSGTVICQHSADNSVWVDLITFTATAAATSETKEVDGTVNRYTRTRHVPGTSITYVMGLARY
jgi:hypothetical protein